MQQSHKTELVKVSRCQRQTLTTQSKRTSWYALYLTTQLCFVDNELSAAPISHLQLAVYTARQSHETGDDGKYLNRTYPGLPS